MLIDETKISNLENENKQLSEEIESHKHLLDNTHKDFHQTKLSYQNLLDDHKELKSSVDKFNRLAYGKITGKGEKSVEKNKTASSFRPNQDKNKENTRRSSKSGIRV